MILNRNDHSYKEVINSHMIRSTCHEKITFSTFSLWSALSFHIVGTTVVKCLVLSRVK